MKPLATITAAILIAACLILPGCMNSILPEMLREERTIAKKIELQKAEIAQSEKALAKLKIDAEADPTAENLAAVAGLDKQTAHAKIQLVSAELDLEEIKAEIAEARGIAAETEAAAIDAAKRYLPPPFGLIAAALVPFGGLLARNVYTAKARRQRDARRDAAVANVIKTVQPLVDGLNDADRAALRRAQTKPARALVDDVQDDLNSNG